MTYDLLNRRMCPLSGITMIWKRLPKSKGGSYEN